jgi:hypothetical protein
LCRPHVAAQLAPSVVEPHAFVVPSVLESKRHQCYMAPLSSLHNLSSQLHLSIPQSLFPAIHGLTHINCSLQTCPQKFNHQLLRTGALRAFTERSLAILLPWHSSFDPQDEGILALLPSVALFLFCCLLIVRRKVIPCARSSMMTVLRMQELIRARPYQRRG